MGAQRGFTYLGLLLAIALLGIGMVAASEVWVTTARRQRMEQLEWVGQQYVQAIGSYYENSPGQVKTYPTALEDLLEDRRFAFTRRHLRQFYANPFSGVADWELVRAAGGGIRGVRVAVPDTVGRNSAYEFSHTPLAR
ncbi:type II secretion system protein [Ideonella sp. YS5]|uniref:type II secretion system protein n=1 Tax=Ideonella sp. YS5 TaxID=3453714 RepID=UPI003EEA7F03